MRKIVGSDGTGVNVSVVGVDVGLRRSVFAFVGVNAEFMYKLFVIYAKQNDVPALPLGAYEGATRAFVADVTYPEIDKYRGPELTNTVIQKVLGALLRAGHSVRNIHGSLIGIAIEDLRLVNPNKRDLAKVQDVWRLALKALSNSAVVCPAVRVSWFWLRYAGEVHMLRDGTPIVLVEPEYTSQTCPRCGRYLGRPRGVVKCSYCGFEADRDVIAAMNIAWIGFLLLVKCVREGVLGVPKGPGRWPWMVVVNSRVYIRVVRLNECVV
jgi:putative transposase